jgi:hypothetical protein
MNGLSSAVQTPHGCPLGTFRFITGYVPPGGVVGYVCLKVTVLTNNGWDSPLKVVIGGGSCTPDSTNVTCPGSWTHWGAALTNNTCPVGSTLSVTSQVQGGPTAFLCVTDSVNTSNGWVLANPELGASAVDIKNVAECSPVYGGGCGSAETNTWQGWTLNSLAHVTLSGITFLNEWILGSWGDLVSHACPVGTTRHSTGMVNYGDVGYMCVQ